MQWKESPAGQHIELGIAEHNLFLLLGALRSRARAVRRRAPADRDALRSLRHPRSRRALSRALLGLALRRRGDAVGREPLARGRRAPVRHHARDRHRAAGHRVLRAGVRAARSSGSCSTRCAASPRAGARAAYLRLSTRTDRPGARAAAEPGLSRARPARCLPARRRARRAGMGPETNAVSLFAAGVMVPEAVDAARALRERGVLASVFVVTSPDRLYRGLRAAAAVSRGRWSSADEEDVPVVSRCSTATRTRSPSSARRSACPRLALGVDDFGQSGARADLYRHYGIDAAAIARAAARSARRAERRSASVTRVAARRLPPDPRPPERCRSRIIRGNGHADRGHEAGIAAGARSDRRARRVLSDPDELLVYESDGLTLFRALADFVVFPARRPSTSRRS